MTRVRSIDSSGIAFLVQMCALSRSGDLDVSVLNPPVVAAEALRAVGCDTLIESAA
jgi:anti-anti-sigma regulatory factor